MKPIEQMSLQECLDLLRKKRMPIVTADGEVFDGMFDHQDRIEIANRIHELTRWIPVEESLPDNGDTVLCRRVESGMFGSKEIKPQVGTFRNGSFDCVFDWTRVTHWRRIDRPEGV